MRRRLAKFLGALALGWFGGSVDAQSEMPLPQPPSAKQQKEQLKDQQILPIIHLADVKADGAPLVDACQDGNCGRRERCGFFTGGTTAYILTPVFETNPYFRLQRAVAGVPFPGQNSLTQTDAVWGMDLSAGGWIGYVTGSGLGARGRWFNYRHSDANLFTAQAGDLIATAAPLGLSFGNIAPLAAGDTVNFNSDLKLDVYDFEVTQNINMGRLELTGAVGIRYAHMAQNFSAFTAAPNIAFVAGAPNVTVVGSHNFNGAGPTLALEAKRQLGQSNLSLYGNGRASVLIGSARETAFLRTGGAVRIGIPDVDASTKQVDILPIGELEVGTEYGRDIGRRLHAFVQFGLLGQAWLGGGNAANNTTMNASNPYAAIAGGSTTPPSPNLPGFPQSTPAFGSSNASNFGMWGFTLRAGFNF